MNNYVLSNDTYLSELDKSRNILISGTAGVGISRYLLNLIKQDIDSLNPVIVFDQYGDLSDELISNSSDEALLKTAYIDIGNKEYPVGLNIFEERKEGKREDTSNFLINLMYDLYDPNRTGVIGPRFEHAVRNAVSTIMYDDKSSFLELLRCLTDAEYVKKALPKVSDPVVQNYWNKQVAQTSDFHKSEILDYIVSKLSIFVTDKMMRSILCQSKSSINFSSLISENRLILFNFGNLRKYNDANKVVTSILLYKLINEFKNHNVNSPVNIYIDEAVSWPTTFITDLLTENKRYGVNLILTTNRISEANSMLKRVLLKAGTLISFRLDTEDARIIAPEFHAQNITADKLCLLKKYSAYIRTLDEGNVVIKEEPVNFESNYSNDIDINKVKEFKADSQKRFGKDYQIIEQDIRERMK